MNDRSQRVETDVNVYRLRLAGLAEGVVVFAWDYPGSTLLRVRILRAVAPTGTAAPGACEPAPEHVPEPERAPEPEPAPEFSPEPEPRPGGPWRTVYDGDTGSFRDRDVSPGDTLRYAVFASNGDGPWALWRDEVVTLP